jgi:hypothetical protein
VLVTGADRRVGVAAVQACWSVVRSLARVIGHDVVEKRKPLITLAE